MSLLEVNPENITSLKGADSADKGAVFCENQENITITSDEAPTIRLTNEEISSIKNDENEQESTSSKAESEENGVEGREEVHNVSVVVTIVTAFPIEEGKEIVDSSNKPRASEGPKPQNFYKFEYQLMPDDPEPLQSDLVTYKVAAKLFPEKSDPKIIKSWEHENKMWIVWTQTHDLELTKSRLLRMFDHEFVLKIWDSRDFCSARAKFDKPKPFKFPKTGEPLEENVKRLVLENCELYLKQIPKELRPRMDRKLPNQARIETPNYVNMNETEAEKLTNTLVAVPLKSATTSHKNKLAELALDTEMVKSIKHLRNAEKKRPKSKSLISKGAAKSESQFDMDSARTGGTKRHSKIREKTKKELAAEIEFIKKNGTARIKLKMKVLFSGETYLAGRLSEPIPTLDDCFVCVNLENDLMSEKQLFDLNPLTIKIEKLTNMPNTPVNFNELKEHCNPVYCTYTFFQQPHYKTEGLLQEKNLFYHDVNVYLLGLLDKQKLHEFLHSTPFEIEIHDRDRKPVTKEQLKACLFGNDVTDENISSVSTTQAKYTVHNPFESKLKTWDPFGIARLNLYDLVMGKKLIEFFVPVLPCTAPDVLGRNVIKNSSQNSKKLDNEHTPSQAGAFLDNNTHLNVKITTAKPVFLIKPFMKEATDINTHSCPFGRIVIKIDSSKKNIVVTLKEVVRRINAEALGFNRYPIQVQEAAMSTHKINKEQSEDNGLNLITGFYMITGKNHLFVLEGLKDVGVKSIFELIPRNKNDTSIEVIYNSKLAFSERLYSNLEIELFTVKLFEPLEEIVRKPLLYIRDMTPKASFDALIKMNQLMTEYRLRSIIRCDLLPTAEMVLSMSKEFGVPFSNFEEDKDMFKSNSSITAKHDNISENCINNDDEDEYGSDKNIIPQTTRVWTPLDNDNDRYLREKLEREKEVPDFILSNIQNINEASEHNRLRKPNRNYMIVNDFSYSSQTKNSTEIALDSFRQYIKENNPKQLYSYNPDSEYTQIFIPVNIKEEEAESKQKTIDKWRSPEGWIFPDVKTTMQSNQHIKKLGQPAIDDLYEHWEENALNTYKLKSPCERTFYKGYLRHKDFDLWKTPKKDFNTNFPITIFEAGAIKDTLNKEVLESEEKVWKNKIVVDDTSLKFHKLSAMSEGKIDGVGSSNQLDKLTGILKGEPKKRGLLVGSFNFNKIPSLSVTKTSYDDQENFSHPSKGFIAGDSFKMRITDDVNKIPVFNYNRPKFERIKGQDFDLLKQPHSQLYKRKLEKIKNNVTQHSQWNEQRTAYIIPSNN